METQPLYWRAIAFYREHGLSLFLRKAFAKSISMILGGPKAKRFIANSKLLTALYFYTQGTYYYEQKKVLNGQALYKKYEQRRRDPTHRRIQYTHILEKGLSVPEAERRDTYGDYVVRTLVDDLEAAWNTATDPTDDEQLLWTIDVLAEYFDTTGENRIISEAEDTYREFTSNIDYTPNGRIPRRRGELAISAVTYEEFKSLAAQRSSTRYFEDQDVPRDLLDKAVEIAATSPSACNRQSFLFRIYDDRSEFEDLLQHRVGTDSYEDNIPVLIVLTGKQRAYKDDSERNTIFIDSSLAAMTFQFALETLGLSSCMINWPMLPKEQKEIAKQLDLDPDEQVINFIAVGYPDPDGKIPYSGKKDLDKIRSYNRRG